MPVPPPGHDNLHTEMRLIAVVEMLDSAVRALRQTIDDMSSGAKPVSDAGPGAHLPDEPEE